MKEDSLYTPEEAVIPEGDTAPPYQNLIDYVWKRVWSWFHGTAEGGIYETLVDVTHYARGWWTWHMISDPHEISGGLPGWANHVYDYFENWPDRAWEWFEEKRNRLEWTFRPTAAGGIWQHLSDTYDRFRDSFASFRNNPTGYVKDRAKETWPDIGQILTDPVGYIRSKLGWTTKDWNEFWANPFHWVVRKLGGNVTFWDYFIKEPLWYISQVIKAWIEEHIPWYDDLIGYIMEAVGWVRSKWDWFWRDPFAFIIAQAGGNTWWWKYFVADPLSYINLYIYGYLRANYPALFQIYTWLTTRWDDLTREIGSFIANPYGYLTKKLQAWIEGWRDYILGVVGDLFASFQTDITTGLVNLTIRVLPTGPIDRFPTYQYPDLDHLMEKFSYWIEGPGATWKDGYDQIFEWARTEVLGEEKKGPPPKPRR